MPPKQTISLNSIPMRGTLYKLFGHFYRMRSKIGIIMLPERVIIVFISSSSESLLFLSYIQDNIRFCGFIVILTSRFLMNSFSFSQAIPPNERRQNSWLFFHLRFIHCPSNKSYLSISELDAFSVQLQTPRLNSSHFFQFTPRYFRLLFFIITWTLIPDQIVLLLSLLCVPILIVFLRFYWRVLSTWLVWQKLAINHSFLLRFQYPSDLFKYSEPVFFSFSFHCRKNMKNAYCICGF